MARPNHTINAPMPVLIRVLLTLHILALNIFVKSVIAMPQVFLAEIAPNIARVLALVAIVEYKIQNIKATMAFVNE